MGLMFVFTVSGSLYVVGLYLSFLPIQANAFVNLSRNFVVLLSDKQVQQMLLSSKRELLMAKNQGPIKITPAVFLKKVDDLAG